MSPMSLAITHEQIKRGADMDLYDIFSMEYNLGEFQFFEDILFSRTNSNGTYRVDL